MKLIIVTLLMFFFASWNAWAKNNLIQYKIVTPPVCINNKSERVQFEQKSSKLPKFSAGMAKRNEKGEPIIYRFSYENSPKAMQWFIDFHECAHHQTGDVDLVHPPQNSYLHMMKESIADCVATLRIRDETNNGKVIILNALIELKKTMGYLGFPISTFDSRKANISNCLKKDISALSFIYSVLKKRELK